MFAVRSNFGWVTLFSCADEFGEDRGTCLVEVLAPDKSEAVGRRGSGVTVGKSDPGRLGVKLGRGIRGLIKLRDRDA